MKKTLIFIICIFGLLPLANAQYLVSINYGNVDWVPKVNKILDYDNVFVLQSLDFGKTGLSLWQASCLTEAPNSYELGGLDYAFRFGKFKTRVSFHGYFPKDNFTEYNGNGNLIPNLGFGYIPDSTQSLIINVYQFWDYKFSSQFFVSNLIYKKGFKFGSIELGEYYNFETQALSGSIAFSKSWQIYKSLGGFSSIRWSFNESKVKQNDDNYVVLNFGLLFKTK